MGLTTLAVLSVGSLMVTLTLNMISGWSVEAICPGSTSFCASVYWRTVVEYLPIWLYAGQLLVVFSLASPFALARIGR